MGICTVSQFCCEPKGAQKNIVYVKKKNDDNYPLEKERGGEGMSIKNPWEWGGGILWKMGEINSHMNTEYWRQKIPAIFPNSMCLALCSEPDLIIKDKNKRQFPGERNST